MRIEIMSSNDKSSVRAEISTLGYIVWPATVLLIVTVILAATKLAVAGFALLLFGGIVLFLRMLVIKLTHSVTLTTRGVEIKTGLIARNVNTLSLRKIETTDLNQSIFGRIFGYGTLVLRGTGSSTDATPLLKDAYRFKEAIEVRMENLLADKDSN
jgi:uncharacterized membrane protein YdbT with pleckstrin-like domain